MAEPLKYRYNNIFFEKLIIDFKTHQADFQGDRFKELLFDDNWEQRELKDRMRHITLCLRAILQMPFAETMELFKKVIKENRGFEYMFFPDYVEVFGLKHLEESLEAMAHFTEWASSEFAIRPFIVKYEERVMQQMNTWTAHKNHHIRRLASEGCRPRLPWAMALPKFKKDPTLVLPILEKLKNDSSEYVRRSVANNLNDISKDHPDVVLKIGATWLGEHPETDWVVKHALRTLLKKGNTEALLLFGFDAPDNVEVLDLTLVCPKVQIGGVLSFQFGLLNKTKRPVKLRLEYAIDFVKKTGKTSQKVFKITENEYPPGTTFLKRRQSFQDFSTRKHYPGTHRVAILVNGVEKGAIEFEVTL